MMGFCGLSQGMSSEFARSLEIPFTMHSLESLQEKFTQMSLRWGMSLRIAGTKVELRGS